MILICAPVNSDPAWPYSLTDLRRENPNVSFSASPTAEDLAQFGVYQVQPSDAPAVNPRTERVEESLPEVVDGIWQQRWTVRNASPEEIAAYDEANAPPPDWSAFLAALLQSSMLGAAQIGAQQILDAELPSAEGLRLERLRRASTALSSIPAVLLAAASSGDPSLFIGAWLILRQAGLVAPEVASGLAQLATAYDLPEDLIRSLGAPDQPA